MIQVCNCDDSFRNTGEALCKALLSAGAGMFAVSYFDQDGNVNEINLATAVLNQTFLDDKINHADPYKRWFPIMNIKNIEDMRGDTVFQEFEDLTKYPVQDGIRAWHGLKPNVTPEWVGHIESFACGKVGIFIVGNAGELQGNIRVADKFRPFLVSEGTWIAKFTKPKNKELSMLDLSFEFDQTERDKDIGVIQASEFDDVNLLLATGLLDVFSTVLTQSTSTLKVKLYGNQGTPLNPNKIKSLVAADFAIYNVTQASAIAFTGTGGAFAESPDGTYEFTYDTADQPTAGDVIRLTPTKTGYDFSEVVANTALTA